MNSNRVGMIIRFYILDNCRSIWWYITNLKPSKKMVTIGYFGHVFEHDIWFWYRDKYKWKSVIEIKTDPKFWKYISFGVKIFASSNLPLGYKHLGECVSTGQNLETWSMSMSMKHNMCMSKPWDLEMKPIIRQSLFSFLCKHAIST